MTDAHKPSRTPAAKNGSMQEEAAPLDWQSLVRDYGRPVLLGAAIAILIVMTVGVVRQRRRAAEHEAARLLTSGRVEQVEKLVERYGRTSSAPIGKLALARLAFHEGRYEEAEQRYAQFLRDHPKHRMATIAEINRATSLEATGRLEEALKTFEAVRARERTSLQGSLALLGRARTYEQMGRYSEARQAYEEYLVLHPDGPFAGVAEAGIKVLEQKRRAAQKLIETSLPSLTQPAGTNAPVVSVPAVAPAAPAGLVPDASQDPTVSSSPGAPSVPSPPAGTGSAPMTLP